MSFLSQLLEHYKISVTDLDSRKESGSFLCLKRPDGLSGFEEVVARIRLAIENHEKTVLYGDYDVDGLTSVTILKLALDALGLNPGFFIPSRYVEGYGLSSSRVKEFHQKGYHLIIALDNGITAFESVELAKNLGMDILVIDHHERQEELPKFDGLFHPKESGFLDYNCSAASLSYFVATRLLGRESDYFAFLAGMAVFSDVMPLKGNNLVFSKMMLPLLKKRRFRNIAYLLGKSECEYDDFNFALIPSLNSPGRIKTDSLSTNMACRFLLELKDEEKIKKYASFLIQCNQERKDCVKKFSEERILPLSSEHAFCFQSSAPSGLSGLLANRLLNEKEVPIFVCCQDEKKSDSFVCSFRVPEGFSLLFLFEKARNFFLNLGGHEKACGGTLLKKDYYIVSTLFVSEMARQSMELKKEENDIEISIEDINPSNYETYCSFMPFGEGFEKPRFSLFFPKEEFHLSPSKKMGFAYNESKTGRILFFEHLDEVASSKEEFIHVKGTFRKSTFQGKDNFEILVSDIIF